MSIEKKECYDVTIIGGGPTGLFSAFYAGMRDMKTKIIEGAPVLGGKLPYYGDKPLYDIGGVLETTGDHLVKELEMQAKTFEPVIVLNQMVEQMKRLPDNTFRLTSNTGDVHFTKTIIIAIGGGTLVPKKLELANAYQYENNHIHYNIEESMERFRDKKVLISGGGDSAVDYALALATIAKSVWVVHRRDEFRAHEGNVAKMKQAPVQLMTSSQLKDINGNGDKIESVTVECVNKGDTFNLPVDDVIVCHGVIPDLGGIKHWGLELENRGTDSIRVNTSMETTVPGLFAAGDVSTYPGKLQGLIAAGFMEGASAISHAKLYLEPEKELKPIWSTFHEKLLSIHEKTSESVK